jgi:hypothetical protein
VATMRGDSDDSGPFSEGERHKGDVLLLHAAT